MPVGCRRNEPLKRDMIGRMPQFVALRGAHVIPPPVDHLGSHPVDLVVRNNLPFTILRLVVAFLHGRFVVIENTSFLSNVFHPVLGEMLINLWISGGSTGLWTARVSMGSSTSLSIEKVLLLVVGIVLQSEIHLSEPWISLQYLSSSGEHDMSMFNDVGTMRDLQAALDALFDQQGGHALAVDLFDRRIDIVDNHRREPH